MGYLRTLWRRKWMILAIAILGCAAAYAWSVRQPRVYQAECTLQYDPNPPHPLGRSVEDVASPTMWWETREYFATQNKIIASRSVAEKVVRKLSLHQNPDFWGVSPADRKAWLAPTVSQAAQALQRMLTVTQERDTRLVHISIKDTNRARAMLLANGVADAYIERTMEDRLGATTGALEWLGKQLDSLKQQLEHSEISLHEFTEQHSNLAVSLDEQKNIVAATIQQLSEALTETNTKRIAAAAHLGELNAAVDDDPLHLRVTSLILNPALVQMREHYRTLLTEHDALVVHDGDQHPKVLAVNAQLATLKEQVRAEVQSLVASAQSDVHEIEQIEKGVQGALEQANRVGLDLNLQEIEYRRLQRERDNTSKLYGTLLERTSETDLTRALQVAVVRIVDPALQPVAPVSPRVQLALLVGTLLGLMLGIGVAVTLDQLDRIVRTVEDAEAMGITILGVMPSIEEGAPAQGTGYARKRKKHAPELIASRDLAVHTHPKSSVAECARTIRTNLTFMSADTPRRVLVVTSASPREGKTTVALSLAISLAQSGKRVLIVDTDLRKPRLHRALGKNLSKGVTTILVGEHNLKEALQETEVPGLTFLPSGPIPPNPSELLHTNQFRELVGDLSRMFDLVIFDSPPLAAVTDAAIIAPQVDGAIIVIHGQRTTREALRSALRQLRDVGSTLVGGILNDIDPTARPYGYGPRYYYYHNEGYYQADPTEPPDDDGRSQRPVAQA